VVRNVIASMNRLTTVLLLGAVLAGGLGPASADAKVTYGSFHSKAVGGNLHYSVVLPGGYTTSTKSYPVVYYLHGLPAGGNTYRGVGWIANAVHATGRRAIVIGVQGARGNDPDAEYLDWGARRNWETAIARELVGEVDSNYRTIARREGRVLVGISAGGYGASLIGYHHPGVFSVIQSWSGYFRPTNPQGTAVLDLGSKQANDWASLHAIVPKMRKRLGRFYRSTYYGFYVGTSDGRFLSDNERLAREMTKYNVPNHLFREYSGGHNMKLWRGHAPAWLGRALHQAASPR
jgi:enterochelin esterase-like enzyme